VHGTEEKKTNKRNRSAVKQIQKETETGLKKKEIKSTVVCVFFSFLQVTGTLTAGRKVKRGGSRSGSPRPVEFLAAARGTVLAFPEGFPCNSCNFKLFNVIFV
jgi:hypothetical protein